MKIKILSEAVASQIAAGEVIERPASVVKELLENAIDARASRILITIEDAGKKLIEVSDDGAGISIDDLHLAVMGHATSKLDSAEDLFHITTLGFRGEALASIGAVSRLTIISRDADLSIGAKIMVEGGKVISQETTGGTSGTLVRVQDLFFNTPARLKFLKRDLTERQQIDGLVTRYALAYPMVAIHLQMDGKPVLQTPGNGNRREILSQLYGVDLAKQLIEVILQEEGIKISGYISPISVNRSNRRDITFFVNGRWIQDTALTAALVKAYQTFLMVGRYPLAVLFLELPPEDIDVNVHPAKAEVRFRNPDLIFTTVQRAARRALMAFSPVPQVSIPTWQYSPADTPHPTAGLDWNSWRDPAPVPAPGEAEPSSGELTSAGGTSILSAIPVLRLVGQIGGTYLVAEGPDGLYLIDQHAAHERVLYEKMTHDIGHMISQEMLVPLVMEFPPQAARQLKENLSILNKIGFQVDDFGVNSIRLSAVPAIFSQQDPQAAIRSVVDDFEEDESPLAGMLEEKLIARICKRMAVKGGTQLSIEEQQALLQDLEACTSPRTCPHGRPTMINLSVDLLERQFGRRGARSS